MLYIDRDLRASENQAREALRVLKESNQSGEPIVLSINGKASLAIEGDRAFRMLFELATWLDSIAELRQSIKELDEGKGIDLEEVRKSLLNTHNHTIESPEPSTEGSDDRVNIQKKV